MELNKKNRQGLLDTLNIVNEKIDIRDKVREHYRKTKDTNMQDYSLVSDWLLEKKKELLEQALINNEIDY